MTRNMTSYRFGDVVLVPFPFTDLEDIKKRPAVVISPQEYQEKRPDIILLAITSRIPTQSDYGESIILNWKEAGLLKPSSLKPVLFTLEQTRILTQLGTLNAKDQDKLQNTLDLMVQRKKVDQG